MLLLRYWRGHGLFFEFVDRVHFHTLHLPCNYCRRNVIHAGEGEIFKFYTSKKEIQFIICHGVFRVQEIR